MRDEHKKLNKKVQRWIYKQGWASLREVQSDALTPILSGKSDVIVSASTAAGKTEAFFLPACSAVADYKDANPNDSNNGVDIIYISPLKALINDQHRRLESLAEVLDMRVTSWHGDSSQSAKKRLRDTPSGILLITPESLEALLLNRAAWARKAFARLRYIVIDEFHAFIGSERGQHLISLLTRLEYITNRVQKPIPRVALSATLGDIDKIPKFLRPVATLPCQIITQKGGGGSIKVQVRGYATQDPDEVDTGHGEQTSDLQVSTDLYHFCRGGNHLVFANSRMQTEVLSSELTDMCQRDIVPNEFFPHHGSLSKEHREQLENRLQKDTLPTTAVCTMTLELGIDIGKVDSVIQVSSPHSVASLRQRLGRSGRRDGVSILRMLISEKKINEKTDFMDCLRLEMVQALAMIRLLLVDKWYEPADEGLYHFSTLMHQTLACIGQWGGIRADELYQVLCRQGPFQNITPQQFGVLLKQMGANEIITQLGDGSLVLGIEGEGLVGHYTFYAAFKTPEEYRIICHGKTIGVLPIDSALLPKQFIILAGKRWQVSHIDNASKTVSVRKVRGGGKPPRFNSLGINIHKRIRQEMYRILSEGDYRIQVGQQKFDFADSTAKSLFYEGVQVFNQYDLAHEDIIEKDGRSYIFSWQSSKTVNALAHILIGRGFEVGICSDTVVVENVSADVLKTVIEQIAQEPLPSAAELASEMAAKEIEKYDEYIPDSLLNEGYAAMFFDIEGLSEWLVSRR